MAEGEGEAPRLPERRGETRTGALMCYIEYYKYNHIDLYFVVIDHLFLFLNFQQGTLYHVENMLFVHN